MKSACLNISMLGHRYYSRLEASICIFHGIVIFSKSTQYKYSMCGLLSEALAAASDSFWALAISWQNPWKNRIHLGKLVVLLPMIKKSAFRYTCFVYRADSVSLLLKHHGAPHQPAASQPRSSSPPRVLVPVDSALSEIRQKNGAMKPSKHRGW